MSVNFGYGGYGMMNGMGMNQAQNQGSGIYQSIANQYSCPMCHQNGPVPYSYKTFVNPLPKQATNPSSFARFINKLFGI